MAPLRKPVLAANWKMNLGPTAASAFVESFVRGYPPRDDRTVILFPSALAFSAARTAAASRADLQFGVQNIHSAETGEKVRRAASEGLVPVLCVGEKIEEREAGQTDAVVVRQLRAALAALPSATTNRVLIEIG